MTEIKKIKEEMDQPLDILEDISKSTLFSYIATLLSSFEEADKEIERLEKRIRGGSKILEFVLKEKEKQVKPLLNK